MTLEISYDKNVEVSKPEGNEKSANHRSDITACISDHTTHFNCYCCSNCTPYPYSKKVKGPLIEPLI